MKLISLIALLIFSFFAYSDYRPDDSVLVLGSKADPSADKEIKTNGDGQGSLVYSEASDEWRFYNTPSEYFTFADFLSGGVSYITGFPNEIKNGDFEAKNYLDGWECTSGKCSLDDSTPMFGEQAVTFEPDLTGEYLRTEFKFMSEGLFSKDCEARATYSLDVDLQLTFRVVDQDLNVIATQDLTETSTGQQAGEALLEFTCPSVADFIADPDSAFLRVEIVNKTDVSAVSEFDNVHLGKPIAAGGGGSGVDVSTDNAIARFDGAEGALQNSGVLVEDSNYISNLAGINGSGLLYLDSGGGISDRISMQEATEFTSSLNFSENTNSVATGTNATIATDGKSLINLRNASLVSVQSISFNGSKERNKILYLVNQTGNDITLVHNNDESGGATNTRINSPTGEDFILKNNYTVSLMYNYHTSIGTHRRGWNILQYKEESPVSFVSEAHLVGYATQAADSNCDYATTISTTLTQIVTDADCSAWVADGITATNDTPEITIASARTDGYYSIRFDGIMRPALGSEGNATFRLYNQTDSYVLNGGAFVRNSYESGDVHNAISYANSIQTEVRFSTSGDKVIDLRAISNSSQDVAILNQDPGDSRFFGFTVYFFPDSGSVAQDTTLLKVSVRASGTQTITTSFDKISLNDEYEDNYNAFNTTTGEFTSPKDACYRVNAKVRVAGGAGSSDMFSRLYIDGASISPIPIEGNRGTTVSNFASVVADVVCMETGEVLTLRGYADPSRTTEASSSLTLVEDPTLKTLNATLKASNITDVVKGEEGSGASSLYSFNVSSNTVSNEIGGSFANSCTVIGGFRRQCSVIPSITKVNCQISCGTQGSADQECDPHIVANSSNITIETTLNGVSSTTQPVSITCHAQ